MDLDFFELREIVKKIKKKEEQPQSYNFKFNLDKKLDLTPSEIENKDFFDLLNEYKRRTKILKIDSFAQHSIEKPTTLSSKDEEKKEIIFERIEKTKKDIEKEEKEELLNNEILIIEKVKEELIRDIEFEKESDEKPILEGKSKEKFSYYDIIPSLDISIEEKNLDSEAKATFQLLLEALPSGDSEKSFLKKKMFDLTKQLFVEKSTLKRQKLKEEINSIRELLSRASLSGTNLENFSNYILTLINNDIRNLKQHLYLFLNEFLMQTGKNLKEKVKFVEGNENEKLINLLNEKFEIVKNNVLSIVEREETFLKNKYELVFKLVKKEKNIELKLNSSSIIEKEFIKIKSAINNYILVWLHLFENYIKNPKEENVNKALEVFILPDTEIINLVHTKYQHLYNLLETPQACKLEILLSIRKKILEDNGANVEFLNKLFRGINI